MFFRLSFAFTALLLLLAPLIGGCERQAPEAARLVEQFNAEYDQRRSASRALIGLGDAAIPFLIEATHAESSIVRWEAVNTLGHIGLSKAIPAILERVITDTDVHVRWRSIWALNRVNDGSSQTHLREHLTSNNPQYRWNAAIAISALGSREAIHILHQGLESDSSWTRWEAANALGRTHNEQSAAILISAYYDGNDTNARQEIILSLGRIGAPEAIPALTDALEDRQREVRWRAAMVLGWIGGESAKSALQSRLAKEEDQLVRKHIENTLPQL